MRFYLQTRFPLTVPYSIKLNLYLLCGDCELIKLQNKWIHDTTEVFTAQQAMHVTQQLIKVYFGDNTDFLIMQIKTFWLHSVYKGTIETEGNPTVFSRLHVQDCRAFHFKTSGRFISWDLGIFCDKRRCQKKVPFQIILEDLSYLELV